MTLTKNETKTNKTHRENMRDKKENKVVQRDHYLVRVWLTRAQEKYEYIIWIVTLTSNLVAQYIVKISLIMCGHLSRDFSQFFLYHVSMDTSLAIMYVISLILWSLRL